MIQKISKVKIQSIIHKRYFSSLNYNNEKATIKNTLNQMFNNVYNKLTLSKTFRLFPSFFNTNKVMEMINSQFIQEYCQHILQFNQTKQNNNLNQDKEINHLKRQLNIDTDKQIRILQIYINYIKRTEDLCQNQVLMQILDIRNPENWFRSNDKGQRKFVYHHGPTNSGKTHFAINQLKNLKPTQKGIYMAPLRLLAWQTQQKLGKCNLVTGQEKDFQNSHLTSCTIQAINLNDFYDLAIIDQIQMIGDQERGWSWTTPLIGIKADKIHLCGDERALRLVSRILAKSQGTLEQRKYVRLSKLELLKNDFQFDQLKPGDCIIDFSYRKLYEHRTKINKMKGTPEKPNQTAIIYGKMPPICRKIQAQKFNSGQLPYLVASDAIGMGLNLNIRRVIFVNIIKKSNDGKNKYLQDHSIRQIAGRAGRGYGHGYVQCLNQQMRQRVKNALKSVNVTLQGNIQQKDNQNTPISPQRSQQIQLNLDQDIKQKQNTQQANQNSSDYYDPSLKRFLKQNELRLQKAGIFFPLPIIQRIKIKMQRLLNRSLRTSQTIRLIINLSKQNKELFFVQSNRQLLNLSDSLESFGLPFQTHYKFANVPLPNNSKVIKKCLINYAWQYKNKGIVTLPENIQNQYLDKFNKYRQQHHIIELQQFFLTLECYTWLWNNFELNFPFNSRGNLIKQQICKKIIEILNNNQEEPPKIRQIRQNTFKKIRKL